MPPRVLNSSFANALGRPDLTYSAQTGSTGAPSVVVGGQGGFVAQTGGGVNLSGGQGAAVFLLFLLGAYTAFVLWVRPHLA